MLNKHNDNIFHTELKNIDYICVMEKRNRYTVQIKTEISQAAAYFVDQIVNESKGRFRSRSEFARVSLILGILSLEPGLENYLSKEEKKVISRFSHSPRNEKKSIIPPEDVINNNNPTGNGKRKRYTVQILTELSEASNDFLFIILDNDNYRYSYDLSSRSNFFHRMILKNIVFYKTEAIDFISEKEREMCEHDEHFF